MARPLVDVAAILNVVLPAEIAVLRNLRNLNVGEVLQDIGLNLTSR